MVTRRGISSIRVDTPGFNDSVYTPGFNDSVGQMEDLVWLLREVNLVLVLTPLDLMIVLGRWKI